MRKNVSIKARCVAANYAGQHEAIAEISSQATASHPARGCLVSVREVENAGSGGRGLIVELYSADPCVFVRVNGRDYRIPA